MIIGLRKTRNRLSEARNVIALPTGVWRRMSIGAVVCQPRPKMTNTASSTSACRSRQSKTSLLSCDLRDPFESKAEAVEELVWTFSQTPKESRELYGAAGPRFKSQTLSARQVGQKLFTEAGVLKGIYLKVIIPSADYPIGVILELIIPKMISQGWLVVHGS